MKLHLTIWLAPGCEGQCAQDREWCSDNVFEPCEECGAMPVKYILAPDQPALAAPPPPEGEAST